MHEGIGVSSAMERIARFHERGAQMEELGQLDIDAVPGWSDTELAKWQSGYQADSPQWLLAQVQWQVRLLNRQAESAGRQANKAAVISGVVGGIMGIAGALLSTWLPWLLGK